MRWEMEEVEPVLERIWDLHDKISDAIHAISRAHFLKSIKALGKSGAREKAGIHPSSSAAEGIGDDTGRGGGDGKSGFVFVKDFGAAAVEMDGDAAMAEARSLHAIRAALENLEDQLEFFHTVQSQQRAEREAAITRLEQSRIILAMRLADHQGKKYKVIEEALAFVGNVRNAGNFVSPEDLYEIQRTQPGENEEDHKGQNLSVLMRMLFSGLALARSSFRIERIGGVLGNAAVFAVSMLALLQLQQVAFRSDPSTAKAESFYRKRDNKNNTHLASSPQSSEVKHLDVLLARG
uniref:Plastid division protein PDV1 n=1 Tax=Ananas comosus var. bracteatus TaxID=296719 RepID=A0A6V7QV18_ANACO